MALPKITSTVGTGLAIGVGAVVLAPVVAPALAKVARPAVKSAIKGGLVFYERARVVGAEAKEALEDLAAEARAELVQREREAAEAAQAETGTQS